MVENVAVVHKGSRDLGITEIHANGHTRIGAASQGQEQPCRTLMTILRRRARTLLGAFLVISMTIFGTVVPADALVVYTPLQTMVSNNGIIPIDLNRDQVRDFAIEISSEPICDAGAMETLPLNPRMSPQLIG